MSTGTKVIQAALQKLGAHSPVKPAHPESIENGRVKLNSYIAQLQDDGIEFGSVPLEAPGSDLSEPLGLTNVIEDNLAILLQPDHPGTQISNQLSVNAKKGYSYMKRKYKVTTIPKPVVRDTLPRGAGALTDYDGSIYFNDGEAIG